MRLIPLTRGYSAQVDDEDFDELSRWKWRYKDGYAVRTTSRRLGMQTIFMHREILQTPEGMQTDHKNRGDTLNNQRANLRICTIAQNAANRRVQRNNTSGYKGVYQHKGRKNWYAYIHVGGRSIHLGSFDSPEDAARAYDEAAGKYFGEFAGLNILEALCN